MISIRRADDRGHFNHGWLNTCHTFSFGLYNDPAHMGFRALRVMNEDRVLPARGFGSHSHENMEIISYILDGALEHRDSMGNGSVLRAGDFQRMSAGRGVVHSEFNPSHEEPVHFYQIWLLPDRHGIDPSYEELRAPDDLDRGVLRLVASPDGRHGSLTIHQDAAVHLAALGESDAVTYALAPGRHAWLQVLRGDVRLGAHVLDEGDGAALSDEPEIIVEAAEDGGEIMLFDLA